jgi:CheY-like chemotaxis protein
MLTVNTKPVPFYHPTKVIFLDDNRAFLDALKLEFFDQINMKTFTDSDEALMFIENNNHYDYHSIFKLVSDVNVDTTTDRVIGFDINQILNCIYDKKRFDYVSILVIDYDMPGANGVEVCQKIKEKKVFKVMLTAEADKDTAIRAFNSGLIDRFIGKSSKDLYSDVALAASELNHQHFIDLSKSIMGGNYSSINMLFKNTLYQQLFSEVLKKSKAIEYYLVDNSGSMLFLDEDANPTWLLIQNSKKLTEQLDLIKGYDVPEKTINLIENKEKILFLFSENEYKENISEWVNYMFDAKNMDDNYNYSIVKGNVTNSIDWNRVVSYSSCLES